MATLARGLRLAVALLTVVPMGTARWDRPTARAAMAVAPLVGAVLGAVTAVLLWALTLVGIPPLVASAVTLGALILLTRALHWDGLADTADGFGAKGGPDQVRAVMKSPDVGAFGALAVVVVALAQVAALAALATDGRWIAVGLAVAFGRLAVTWACRRGVPAATDTGLGAMVAGGLPVAVPLGWTVAFAALGWFAVDGRPWLGPVGLVVALAGSGLVVARGVRRAGGITGDLLGAAVETTVVLALVVLSG